MSIGIISKTAQQCGLGFFQVSDLARDLEDSKSTSGGTLCVFGSHGFVPISWMCKKQTCVSHSLTEAEIIAFDAGLRLDGIPALDLWDLVIEVLHSDSNPNRGSSQSGATCLLIKHQRKNSATHKILLNYRMLILFPQTGSIPMKERSCTFLRTMKR